MLIGSILSAKTAKQRVINSNWKWQDVFTDNTHARFIILFDPSWKNVKPVIKNIGVFYIKQILWLLLIRTETTYWLPLTGSHFFTGLQWFFKSTGIKLTFLSSLKIVFQIIYKQKF